MKKVLLAFSTVITSLVYSQGLTCATATSISAGTHTAPSITGTYVGTCAANGNLATGANALWYSYTPTANGEVTISSNLAANDGVALSDDTRFSVFTGTCAALSCHSGNDDIGGTPEVYLSQATFPVSAGTTYYIQWDDRWSDLGFQWSLTFNAASCIRPNEYSINTPYATSTTNAVVSWSAAVGPPASYDVEYGPTGFTQGTGTIVNSTATNATISGAAGAAVLYYLRSNCTSSQSPWIGPYRAFNALDTTTTGYPYGFDNTNGIAADGWSGAWSTNNGAGNPQAGAQMVFSNSSTVTTTPTNRWLYSRPIYLSGGNSYQITFYLRNFTAATPIPAQSLQLKVGNQPNPTAQTTTVWSTTSFAASTWTQMTTTFSPTTSGVYYFGFNHNTPGAAGAVSLALDTFNIAAGVLGTKESDLKKVKFTLHPNPVSNVLNIDTNDKIKSVMVFDVSGRKLEVSVKENKVDVSQLQSGTYLITVETKEGVSTEKFIKK